MRFKHLLDTRIGAYHAMVPMAEVDTIGAGGGSIAYVDAGGQFQVGPRSAGADPGPCCYGKGGTEPTATDCQLVLGRLDPGGFLGGRLALDPGLARRAVEAKLAGPLAMSVEDAALAAVRILTHGMVQAIEVNSVRRGYDPREFALVAFGGAGPLFGCDIARELAIPVVIVPPAPGLTSALGLLTSDVAYDFSTTLIQNLARPDLARLAAAIADLEARALEQLERDGLRGDRVALARHVECRYAGQGYELRASAPPGTVDADFVAAVQTAFHAAHRREYGRDFAEKDVELVNVRVVGVGRIPKIAPALLPAGGDAPEPAARAGSRPVVFESGGKAVRARSGDLPPRRAARGQPHRGAGDRAADGHDDGHPAAAGCEGRSVRQPDRAAVGARGRQSARCRRARAMAQRPRPSQDPAREHLSPASSSCRGQTAGCPASTAGRATTRPRRPWRPPGHDGLHAAGWVRRTRPRQPAIRSQPTVRRLAPSEFRLAGGE